MCARPFANDTPKVVVYVVKAYAQNIFDDSKLLVFSNISDGASEFDGFAAFVRTRIRIRPFIHWKE